MKQWKVLAKFLVILYIGNSQISQAGPRESMERINVIGGYWRAGQTSYAGYDASGWGNLQFTTTRDQNRNGSPYKMCEAWTKSRLKECTQDQYDTHTNTLATECSYKSVVQGGANGVVIQVSLSRDEYTMCKDLADSTRARNINRCELNQAKTMDEICSGLH